MERLAAGSLAVARSRGTELSIVKHVWRVVLVMLLAVFCVDGFCDCSFSWERCNNALGNSVCSAACTQCSGFTCNFDKSMLIGRKFDQTTTLGATQYCVITDSDTRCSDLSTAQVKVQCCGLLCERERIQCELKGWTFVDSTCECLEPCDQTLCDGYQSQCAQMQGTFTGDVRRIDGACCCVSNCNICSKEALKTKMEQKTKQCCGQNMAPPEDTRRCSQMLERGCGMSVPALVGESGDNWACRDPNLSNEALTSFVENCYGSSSSTAGSSSGGVSSDGGGTSDGGGSSGEIPPYPEGCDECPWLDSILDTLTAQKAIVGAIYDCMYVPNLCNTEQTTSESFQFDTAWYNYVRPYLDTSLRLDSQQLEALKRLDTNQLKLLESNIEQLRNDTLIRLAVSGGFSQTQDAISQARSSIVHLNDTTRKWLDRISSKIGFTTDSLIAHIDSVRKDIPVQVLDSILKYQKQLAEKEDSIVLGDLPAIDSLIDSVVFYWRMSIYNDSVRRLENNDSLYALHDAIDAVALRMSYLLGYGDTASSDLRKDLFSMNDTVKAHFDSIAARLGISTDSLIAHIDGLNGSMDSLRVDLNGFSESFRTYRDSVIAYFGAFLSAESSYNVTFKDSIGAIHGALGELLAKFSPGAIDTNGLGVWASYMRSGENMGDSIVRSYGWQNLKNFDVDSNYSAALAGFPNKTDSVSAVVDDSLSNRAARLNDSLVRKNDSLKRSLPDTLTKYADSLVIWAPFADFDSIIYSTIGTRIPNRDDCPEDCQSWSVSIPVIGLVNYTVDYGLCLGRTSLGNLSVLAFLKLLIRIIVAITCVMIIYRTLVAIK